jgi:ketosteroid isomerase-like protein
MRRIKDASAKPSEETPSIEVNGMSKGKQPDEKAVIAEVIRNNIMWALTKDVAMQESTMAHDEDLFYFWTGSTHIVSGWEEHAKSFETWMDPRFKAVRTEVRDLAIHLSRSGDVAWYSATLDDVVSWDGKVSRFGEGLRWTGVLEKRDGRWVIVQMHASLAVDKVRDIVLAEKASGT